MPMGNPKKDSKHFQPRHLGLASRKYDGNMGKKYQTKPEHGGGTIWAQPKGN